MPDEDLDDSVRLLCGRGAARPDAHPAQAQEIAEEHFGIDAAATALGSQQDANFLLSAPDGEPVGVLKIANPAFSRAELEAQDAAGRTATNVRRPGTAQIAELPAEDGTVLFARVIALLTGGTMSGAHYVTPASTAALGALAGRTCRALAGSTMCSARGGDRVEPSPSGPPARRG